MNTSSWNIYHFSHIFGSWTLSWGPHPVPFIGFVGLVAGLVDVSPQSARCKPIDICSLVTPLNELRWTNPLTNWAEPPGRFRKLVLLIQKKSGGYGVGSWQVSVWVGRHSVAMPMWKMMNVKLATLVAAQLGWLIRMIRAGTTKHDWDGTAGSSLTSSFGMMKS